MFFVYLMVASLVVCVVRIYCFDCVESVFGDHRDNLMLMLITSTVVAVVITVGFAAVLLLRAQDNKSFNVFMVLIAAILACGLTYAPEVFSPRLFPLSCYKLRLGLFALYSFFIGAVIAAGLMRLNCAASVLLNKGCDAH